MEKRAKKQRTSFALSKNALELLRTYSETKGISMASTLEMFIRENAKLAA